MNTQRKNLLNAGLYYLIAFGLAMLIAVTLGRGSGGGIELLSMLTPLVAVLLMMLVVTRDGYTRSGWKLLGLHRTGGWRYWGLAIWLPALILGCTYGITWAVGIGRFTPTNYGGTINLLLNLIVGTLFALTEEIGWRGYLLPHLLPLGRKRALILSGLLHGLWHLPLMLLTPFYHVTGNRLLVVPLFLLTLSAAGVVYGYLRLRSESVWPAALAHSALNTLWWQFSTLTVAVASPLLLEYLAGESGLITLIGVTLLAGWLLYRWDPEPNAGQIAPVIARESLVQL